MERDTVLLVATRGGHLAELAVLVDRIPWITERRWVVPRSPQSEVLLAGEEVVWDPLVGIRDVRGGLRSWVRARSVIGPDVTAVVSTGSAIALGYLPVAAARRIPTYYIETATRTGGPSMTGRLLRFVPGVSLHTQSRAWAGGTWRYAGSVFDAFEPAPPASSPASVRRVLLTLGTMKDYGFRRLVERLLHVIPDGVEVRWQVGCTDVSGLPVDGEVLIPTDDLRRAMTEADVVVGHCGCGTALAALELGVHPVLVPRDPARGENVDDHQALLGADLADRGLATVLDAGDLGFEHLEEAARRRVRPAATLPPLDLPPPGPRGGRRAWSQRMSPRSSGAVHSWVAGSR